MGYDIHAFLETSEDEAFLASVFCFAEIHLSRNSEVFRAIAPVRGGALITLRGIPPRLSADAMRSMSLYVLDELHELEDSIDRTVITRTGADAMIAQGKTQYQSDYQGLEDKNFIWNPECLYPGFLSRDEFIRCLEFAQVDIQSLAWDWQLLLKNMEWLEGHLGSQKVRLFFWFDG